MHKTCAGCARPVRQVEMVLEPGTKKGPVIFKFLNNFIMKKLSFGLPVLALVLAVAASAFTSKTSLQEWHLIAGKSGSQLFQEASYEPVPSNVSCNNAEVVPCVIQFDTQEFPDLQDYLDSFNGSQTALTVDAISTRSN